MDSNGESTESASQRRPVAQHRQVIFGRFSKCLDRVKSGALDPPQNVSHKQKWYTAQRNNICFHSKEICLGTSRRRGSGHCDE